jgi:uncharacterized lipoprotein YmbA
MNGDHRAVRRLACGLLISLVTLGACSTSPQSRFYTLTADTSTAAVAPFAYAVSVGPVTLPQVVNRPQFVVDAPGNRVVVLEQRRWAAPLADVIAEATAQYLGRDLGGARVTMFAQTASAGAQFDVALDVQRFEMIEGTAAVLDVVWTIKRRGATGAPTIGRGSVREPVAQTDDPYDALAAAQARALASVSREIAASLVQVSAA